MTACIPGLRSLLVELDPLTADLEAVRDAVTSRLASRGRAAVGARLRTIPVVYGGEMGPDLDDVAALTGLSEAEVVERHAAAELRVLFDGFAPGFAYLGELPIDLRVARLATPRTRTPAGSVGDRRADERHLPGDAPRRLAGHRSHARSPSSTRGAIRPRT